MTMCLLHWRSASEKYGGMDNGSSKSVRVSVQVLALPRGRLVQRRVEGPDYLAGGSPSNIRNQVAIDASFRNVAPNPGLTLPCLSRFFSGPRSSLEGILELLEATCALGGISDATIALLEASLPLLDAS